MRLLPEETMNCKLENAQTDIYSGVQLLESLYIYNHSTL